MPTTGYSSSSCLFLQNANTLRTHPLLSMQTLDISALCLPKKHLWRSPCYRISIRNINISFPCPLFILLIKSRISSFCSFSRLPTCFGHLATHCCTVYPTPAYIYQQLLRSLSSPNKARLVRLPLRSELLVLSILAVQMNKVCFKFPMSYVLFPISLQIQPMVISPIRK